MRSLFILFAASYIAGAALGEETAPEWKCLSDSLDGWKAMGGEWNVADGVITGRLSKTPEEMPLQINCWLLYEQEFADLELEFEFRTPAPTNGIGSRRYRFRKAFRLTMPDMTYTDIRSTSRHVSARVRAA